MVDIYQKMKKYRVQAASVEDFMQRYAKHQQRGSEYVSAVLDRMHQDMKKYVYTIISRHESVTGDVVAYYGND